MDIDSAWCIWIVHPHTYELFNSVIRFTLFFLGSTCTGGHRGREVFEVPLSSWHILVSPSLTITSEVVSACILGQAHSNLHAVNGLFGRSCHFIDAIRRGLYFLWVLISEVWQLFDISGLVKYVLLYQKVQDYSENYMALWFGVNVLHNCSTYNSLRCKSVWFVTIFFIVSMTGNVYQHFNLTDCWA